MKGFPKTGPCFFWIMFYSQPRLIPAVDDWQKSKAYWLVSFPPPQKWKKCIYLIEGRKWLPCLSLQYASSARVSLFVLLPFYFYFFAKFAIFKCLKQNNSLSGSYSPLRTNALTRNTQRMMVTDSWKRKTSYRSNGAPASPRSATWRLWKSES